MEESCPVISRNFLVSGFSEVVLARGPLGVVGVFENLIETIRFLEVKR